MQAAKMEQGISILRSSQTWYIYVLVPTLLQNVVEGTQLISTASRTGSLQSFCFLNTLPILGCAHAENKSSSLASIMGQWDHSPRKRIQQIKLYMRYPNSKTGFFQTGLRSISLYSPGTIVLIFRPLLFIRCQRRVMNAIGLNEGLLLFQHWGLVIVLVGNRRVLQGVFRGGNGCYF